MLAIADGILLQLYTERHNAQGIDKTACVLYNVWKAVCLTHTQSIACIALQSRGFNREESEAFDVQNKPRLSSIPSLSFSSFSLFSSLTLSLYSSFFCDSSCWFCLHDDSFTQNGKKVKKGEKRVNKQKSREKKESPIKRDVGFN